MKTIMRIFILLSLLVNFFTPVMGAELEATVESTKVAEGESLILHLVAPNAGQDNPDLSVLTTDFDVISQSQSTNMTIINGNSSSTREWDITLMPKRTGTVTIPVISMGNLTSDPIKLQVLPADQSHKIDKARPVIVETEVDTSRPYVQAQIIYKVRILHNDKARQMRLTSPTANDAMLEHLGEGTEYQIERDGQKYNVKERIYAVFPQHSGPLTIEGPILSAVVPEPGGRNMVLRDPFFGVPFGDPFGNMGSPFTKPIQTRGPNLTLDVKPQPPDSGTPWLPAEELQLHATWATDPPSFRVGEPTTRTITVRAKGLSAAQIPDLTFALPPGIRAYSDKPQAQDQPDIAGMVATKVFKQALVPDRPGSMELPAISVAWWNTLTDKLETTEIPAYTLDVLPALQNAPSNNQTPTKLPDSNTQVEPPKIISTDTTKLESSAPPDESQNNPHIYWIWSAIIFGLAWLVTLGLWLLERHRHVAKLAAVPEKTLVTPKISDAKAKIKQSCNINDAKATRVALLSWGAARWPDDPPKHLDALAARLGPEAINMVQELERYLYSQQTAIVPWDGKMAWQILAPILDNAVRHKIKINPLPDLYPSYN